MGIENGAGILDTDDNVNGTGDIEAACHFGVGAVFFEVIPEGLGVFAPEEIFVDFRLGIFRCGGISG